MLLSSALMARNRQAFLIAVVLGVTSFVQPQPHAETQTDVTGEWEASYQTPLGPQELKIYLTQEGPRISGHTSSEYGESQVRGTINSQDIQFTFQSTDGGRAIDVRVTAKVEGERMRGQDGLGMVERELQARNDEQSVRSPGARCLALDLGKVERERRLLDRAEVQAFFLAPGIVRPHHVIRDAEDVEAAPAVQVDEVGDGELTVAPACMGVELAEERAEASSHPQERARRRCSGVIN